MILTSVWVCLIKQSTYTSRKCGLVDCHNSFKENQDVLPGNPEVFQLLDAAEKLEKLTKKI